MPDEPLISFEDAAAYLHVPEATLRYWLYKDIGPRSYKIGKYRRFRRADLDAFIESRADRDLNLADDYRPR